LTVTMVMDTPKQKQIITTSNYAKLEATRSYRYPNQIGDVRREHTV